MATTNSNRILQLYARLETLPLGRRLFAWIICRNAPYFSTIRPRFLSFGAGRVVVSMRKRRSVENHIRSIHALAMGNLCELAAGTLMEASVPSGLRWLPRGMQIDYLAPARSDIVAEAILEKSSWPGKEDVEVPVSVRDNHGQEVVRARIIMHVSPRPAAADRQSQPAPG
jgi:acyl-coenzyme A thioesterase PaaI-like protein